MDLPLVKYHIQELCKLIRQERSGGSFAQLVGQLETHLNSSPLKNIKEGHLIPLNALQSERKRRQAVENLLKRVQENPAYPDEVKADIAKAHQETMKEYHGQMKSLRQTQKQPTSKAD